MAITAYKYLGSALLVYAPAKTFSVNTCALLTEQPYCIRTKKATGGSSLPILACLARTQQATEPCQ